MERLLFGILIKKREKVIDLGDGWIENLSWSHDGEMLFSCSRTVYVYTKEGNEMWQSNNHNSTVSNLGWSINKELATTCYGRVSFFDGMSERKTEIKWKGSLVSMVLSFK